MAKETIKVGCVPYGHAKPLAGAWEGLPVVWGHPKELAAKLRSGEVDLALVPVWDVLSRPGARVIDGVAVGSRGEVRSVGVFHDRPLAECRSISLTPHSITSVQLWRLIAAHQKIKLREEKDGEARLLIGDLALAEWNRRSGQGVLDLGQAWFTWTGKPFVFAVWALGPGVVLSAEEVERFRRKCGEGIARRGDLAESPGEQEYLTRCIRYELGAGEKAGMEEFAQRSGLGKMEIEWV